MKKVEQCRMARLPIMQKVLQLDGCSDFVVVVISLVLPKLLLSNKTKFVFFILLKKI